MHHKNQFSSLTAIPAPSVVLFHLLCFIPPTFCLVRVEMQKGMGQALLGRQPLMFYLFVCLVYFYPALPSRSVGWYTCFLPPFYDHDT